MRQSVDYKRFVLLIFKFCSVFCCIFFLLLLLSLVFRAGFCVWVWKRMSGCFSLCPFFGLRASVTEATGAVSGCCCSFSCQAFVEDTLTETWTRVGRARARLHDDIATIAKVFVVFVDFYFSVRCVDTELLVYVWNFFNCSCCRRRRRLCRLIANTKHTPSQNLSFLTVARPSFCFFVGVACTRSRNWNGWRCAWPEEEDSTATEQTAK